MLPAPAPGTAVAFSTGPDSQNDAGLRLSGLSGPIPVSRLSMGPSQIRLATSPQGGGGEPPGTLRVYLAAEGDTVTFLLRSTADPGVRVTAQIGESVPQVVNRTQTLFSWERI